VISIGFDDPGEAEQARAIVREFLAAFSLAEDVRFTADLDQSWERRPDNTESIGVVAKPDIVRMRGGIRVQILDGRAVYTYDNETPKVSASSEMVKKAQKSPELANALTYYSAEVVDTERPLYGVYKALEELVHTTGSRRALAALAGQPAKYVSDVMETTQLTRHARTRARKILSERECRNRCRLLIDAFAKSI
jgi:hypothetical protein